MDIRGEKALLTYGEIYWLQEITLDRTNGMTGLAQRIFDARLQVLTEHTGRPDIIPVAVKDRHGQAGVLAFIKYMTGLHKAEREFSAGLAAPESHIVPIVLGASERVNILDIAQARYEHALDATTNWTTYNKSCEADVLAMNALQQPENLIDAFAIHEALQNPSTKESVEEIDFEELFAEINVTAGIIRALSSNE